jgi:hypothetical protein
MQTLSPVHRACECYKWRMSKLPTAVETRYIAKSVKKQARVRSNICRSWLFQARSGSARPQTPAGVSSTKKSPDLKRMSAGAVTVPCTLREARVAAVAPATSRATERTAADAKQRAQLQLRLPEMCASRSLCRLRLRLRRKPLLQLRQLLLFLFLQHAITCEEAQPGKLPCAAAQTARSADSAQRARTLSSFFACRAGA